MLGLLGSSFVGRDDEVDEVHRVLGTRRLVTLVGEGGVGKTRLAAEVSRSLERSGNRVVWVDLARVSDGTGVRAAFEDALRVDDAEGGLAELLELVATESFLVVVDNCEHVAPRAAEHVAILVEACRSARVLATSRSRLGLPGERVVPVRPLGLPDPEAPAGAPVSSAAVELLVDRLADALGAFELDSENWDDVTALARVTEGVPLAIELACARAAALPLSELVRGVESLLVRPTDGVWVDRHRSLDASVRWSVELLSARGVDGLLALSVFAESCCVETAGGVLGAQVVPVLEELVEASLLRRDEARFRLPAAVRGWARSAVGVRGDSDALRDRHADVIGDLAHAAHQGLRGPDPSLWLRRLDDELAELREAMDWLARRDRPDEAVRMLRLTYRHWFARGRYREATVRLGRLLDHPRLDGSDAAAARATASIVALLAGHLDDAHEHADRLLMSGVDLDPETRVEALLNRAWSGFFSGREGDVSRSGDFAAALVTAEAHGLDEAIVAALLRRGILTLYAESIPRGLALLGEVVARLDGHDALYEAIQAQTFQAYGPAILGLDVDERSEVANGAVEACRTVGHVGFEVMGLAALATLAALRGDRAEAQRRMDEAERLAADQPLSTFANIVARWRAFVSYRFDLPRVLADAERALALATRTANEWDATADRWLLGVIGWRSGDRAIARRRWEEAAAGSDDPRFAFSWIRSGLGLALVDLVEDRFESASARVHGALVEASDVGDRLATASGLDHLARLECGRHAFERAARFAGAADAIHLGAGVERLPLEADLRREVGRLVTEALGRKDADIAVEGGRSLDEAAAVRLARRARGRRSRPVAGWDSLTPTEVEVAELAVAGCTNPEIADRLFMSRNTVKTHLSHVYGKLDVAGRTELAARWALEREPS